MHNLKRSGKEQGDRKEQKNLNANLKFAGRNTSVELKVKGSRSFHFSMFFLGITASCGRVSMSEMLTLISLFDLL